MRRAIRTGLSLFVAFSGLCQGGIVKTHGALKVQGHKIVDAGGKPIQLAGMSIYWSVFGSNWGANQFFNAAVVSTLTNDWKSSLVRAPAGVISGSGQNVYNYPGTMNLIKTVVDAAIANDIYVIVDWHLENSTPELASAKQFFTEMSQTYKNTPNVIWEIWNEPKDVAWSEIKSYANTMIPLIRQNSSNLIVVGTPNWSHNPDQAAEDPITIDENVAYAFHFYADQNSNGNIDADNNTAMAAADKAIQKVPVMMTEWGTVGNSGSGNVNTNWSDKWLAWAKTNDVSWANWSLSNKSESSAALTTSAGTNGGWSDGNLSTSGKYVKGKIAEVAEILAKDTGSVVVDPPPTTQLDTFDLPGHIEAETTSVLSTDGLKAEATTDQGGGSALGYSTNDSWAEYTVRLSQTGSDTLKARVASGNSGTLTFKLSGNQIATLDVPSTGGWQNWQTMQTPVQINNQGVQNLRVEWSGSASSLVNLNWIELVPTSTSVRRIGVDAGLRVRAGIGSLDLELPQDATALTVTDTRGRVLYRQFLSGKKTLSVPLAAKGVLFVEIDTPQGRRRSVVATTR